MSLVKCSILTTFQLYSHLPDDYENISNLKFSINNQSKTFISLVGKNLQSTKLSFRVSNCAQPTQLPAIISQRYFPLDVYLGPWQKSVMELFLRKIVKGKKPLLFFPKTGHDKCLTGFLIRLCPITLSFQDSPPMYLHWMF